MFVLSQEYVAGTLNLYLLKQHCFILKLVRLQTAGTSLKVNLQVISARVTVQSSFNRLAALSICYYNHTVLTIEAKH